MSQLTRKEESALKLSIKKWEQIAQGEMIDDGPENCALCQEFYDYFLGCKKCPVFQEVNKPMCYGTPYVAWMNAVAKSDPGFNDDYFVADTPERLAAANAELAFLKGILKRRGRK